MPRVYSSIRIEHLEHLKSLSLQELDRLLNDVGKGKYSVYKNRLIAVCLCQGFAQHFVEISQEPDSRIDVKDLVSEEEITQQGYKIDEQGVVLSGIKDVDVWFFFEDHPQIRIPNMANMRKSIYANLDGIGEIKIDFLKKGLESTFVGDLKASDPSGVVREYLIKGHTDTSWHLRENQ